MNHGYRFDRECEKERKRRAKEAEIHKRLEKAARVIAAAPDLLAACTAWMKVESEMRCPLIRGNNPCPDLVLRANYRKEAVRLTKAAIAKAKEGSNENEG